MPPFLAHLRDSSGPVITVELRPPRAELEAAEGMDAWIDTHLAISKLTRQAVHVFLTDSAVGAQEENNLRHLVANVGDRASLARVVPFLTAKHSLEFCLEYADQAVQHGFDSLVVLGGDKHVGRPRAVEHAWQLRELIRARHPELALGGWANPTSDARRQVDYLLDANAHADFYLTQVVSHHQLPQVSAFLEEADRRGATMPGVFGIFYYRSGNPKTLAMLSQFLPVPVDALTEEFAAGATPTDVCARTLRALIALGARRFYISNLPLPTAAATLNRILDAARIELRTMA